MNIKVNIRRVARGFAKVEERMEEELAIEAKSEHQPRAKLFLVGCWLVVMYLLLGGCSVAQAGELPAASGDGGSVVLMWIMIVVAVLVVARLCEQLFELYRWRL